jgi:hypothetical protein
MSERLVLRITFGAKSTKELEEAVMDLLGSLTADQSASIAMYRNSSLDVRIIADTGVKEYYGTDAYNLIEGFVDVTKMIGREDVRKERASYISVQYPPTDKHLTKTYMVPYAQVSIDGPAIGPGAKYTPHDYMAQEGPGFYPRHIDNYHYKPILDAKFRVSTII